MAKLDASEDIGRLKVGCDVTDRWGVWKTDSIANFEPLSEKECDRRRKIPVEIAINHG